MVTERSAHESPSQRAAEQVVLVVDDDEDLADTCQYWLDGERFTVETAYGGEAALSRIDEHVDVVLLDRRMPNVTGDDVLDEIRDRGLDCRVAMMTAVEPDTDIVDMAFDAYLVKPVSEAEVKETVEELLVRSDFESEVREYFALESTEAALESREVEKLREPEALDDLRGRLEAVRAEHEAAIQNREAQLDRLSRVNGLIRDIDRALIDARTRDKIEQTVCDSVAAAHEAAYVLRRTAAGTHRCTASAGLSVEPEAVDLSFVDEAFDSDGIVGDGYIFDRISDEHRAAMFGARASDLGDISALCVPIVYRDTVYGALVVYDEARQFDDESAALFSDLGATVGNGINAVQSKRLLNGDSVVELEFQLERDASTLAAVAADLGCTLSLDGVTRLDDELACFVTVGGVSGTDAVEVVAKYTDVLRARIVSDGDDEAVLELRIDEEAVLATAIDHGASVDRLELTDGNGTLVLHVAADADHGAIVEAVTKSVPGVSVLAKREVERAVQSADSFRRELDSKLTDRQKTVLETSLVSGYFEWPRGSTAEEVADSLGISPPTLHEHLRTAERKLIETYFDEIAPRSADD
ncbi:response regulator [Haloferax mediterranei ATCC 33500]|uniref:Bacterio-opsin activator n=1 Tax=Haloferax mediterranei (strain ATCC 33500 / DSM 1411 / JCM 8866 / NBRC 14739 / NCIMB 2177 / R-4) TaxID=523841 RepID=I3R4I6_HALMT|nr:bacterio-opsin activator domain-containing protein [Haloferax mediterranei]AFK19146.2 bacterio-opsin activator [Haloferax mediterranei ATCC 33500]AHZ21492.1 chemotaxis protein CheY [Haloferax mediterranei ATCC 33500]EMA03953.1 bacterio-opsin activator [Haloferax mediterranei ATCC 33500]MDX5989243.1 bacterio-opsin activator domain-containing protein [Haloferax mediterranei ATCC 33500]QCQ75617.1 response regulator [Haloferax mediterranei ATCC 33500]